nr:zinc finger, CCHC-type [Tanacetum cinerariifolium]
FFGWLASIKQGILEPVKFKCIFLGYHKIRVANKLWRLDDVTSKVVLYRNIGFNESVEYKKTFIGSGAGTSSMEVLHGFEFEVELLGDHTFEVEPQENIDQGAGLKEVQTQDLIDYQLARDRKQHLACELFEYREDNNEDAFKVAAVEKIYAHESLTFNNIVVCKVISKWKAGLKDDMDARSDVYVLSNGCRKCSDDIDGYYWKYTMDQNGNTLRVSQSRIHNEKLVQTLLKGHSTLSLEDSLSMDCYVKNMIRGDDLGNGEMEDTWRLRRSGGRLDLTRTRVFVDFDYVMGRSITVMSRSITGCGLMILGCAGSLKANLWHMEALLTTEAGYITFTEVLGNLGQLRWPPMVILGRLLPHAKGLGFKPRHGGLPSGAKKEWEGECSSLAYYPIGCHCIATGALVKGDSRSEVPAQVKVAAYR